MRLFNNPRLTITGILSASLVIIASMLPLTVPATAALTKPQATAEQPTPFNTAAAQTPSSTTTATTATHPAPTPTPAVTATTAAKATQAAFKAIQNVKTTGSNWRHITLTPTPQPTSAPTPTSTPSSSTTAPSQTSSSTSAPTTTPTTTTSTTTSNPTPTTTPSQTSSPTPTTNPNAMPTGNQTGWTQIYAQDFNTNATLGQLANIYGSTLLGYNGYTDTSGNGTYAPNQVLSVTNGYLDYYLHYANGKYLTAAPAPLGYTGQTYGKYSIRFRADTIPGYKIAFLLWPDSNTWSDGEIDFPEAELGGDINAYSHNVTGNPNQNQFAWDTGTTTNNWHTLTIQWTPNHLTYTIDGVSKTTTDKAAIPTKPMHLILQAETDLDGIKPSTSAAGHIQIDWITIYKYTP